MCGCLVVGEIREAFFFFLFVFFCLRGNFLGFAVRFPYMRSSEVSLLGLLTEEIQDRRTSWCFFWNFWINIAVNINVYTRHH